MKSENKHIVVVGSINTDMTVKSGKLPRPGETVLGGVFFKNQGGKGANQAVAAARLGASVRMIAKVGKDAFGEESVASLAREGVDTAGILTDAEHPSGIAMILVDDRGENMISVASGANLALTPEELGAVEEIIRSAGIVLMQLEIPMPVIEYVARMAKQHGATVILNPAPAPKQQLPPELLAHVDILIPNQTEAELISGTAVNDYESAAAAAGKIGGPDRNHHHGRPRRVRLRQRERKFGNNRCETGQGDRHHSGRGLLLRSAVRSAQRGPAVE